MQFTWEMCRGDEIKIQVFETVKSRLPPAAIQIQ